MVDREKIVSPQVYIQRYQERFGTQPQPLGSCAALELHSLNFPLLHIQRFLHTGQFNSMFDHIMLESDVALVGFLQESTQQTMFEDFPRLQISPQVQFVTQEFLTQKGKKESGFVATGPYLPSFDRIPETTGIMSQPGRIARIEMRFLHRYLGPERQPINFVQKVEKNLSRKQKTVRRLFHL